jgi:hypothetical protein
VEQFPSGYPCHFIINSRPLWAPPLGTKKNKIPKLGGYVVHVLSFYAQDGGLTNLFVAAGMSSSPLLCPWITLRLRLEAHACPLRDMGREKFLGEQTCKPSSVPRPSRSGDHPSSPDVTIKVKRPTQGSRPSALNLFQSPETLGWLSPSIWSCSGRGLSGQPVSRLPVSSYLAISPLPAPVKPAAGGVFLWHFP